MQDEYDLDDEYQDDTSFSKDINLSYSFDHTKQEALFLKASNQDRLHHAWLLHGPKGLGKLIFALKASRWIMSHQRSSQSLEISPHDPDAQLIEAGTHPDFQLLQAGHGIDKGKKIISVDRVRHLQSFIQQTPSRGGKKICIIDSADQLNANSSNALLKILEEPPKHMVIFILNHSSQALLPTLRSRCFKLAFRPLNERQIRQIFSQKSISEELFSLSQGIPSVLETLARKNWRDMSDLIDQLLTHQIKDAQTYYKLVKSVFAERIKNDPVKSSDLFLLILLSKINSRSLEAQSLDVASYWAELWCEIIEIIDLPKAINLDEELLMHQIMSKINQSRLQRM